MRAPAEGAPVVAAVITGLREREPHCPGRSGRRAGTERPTRGVAAGLTRTSSLVALASLIGCTTVPPQDDLAADIAGYYARHASEEDGRCTSPEIADVTKRKVLASSGEATRLRVRYSYFDASAPGGIGWTRVLQAKRECAGVAERDFTLVSTDLGYKVIEMSGPVRKQP